VIGSAFDELVAASKAGWLADAASLCRVLDPPAGDETIHLLDAATLPEEARRNALAWTAPGLDRVFHDRLINEADRQFFKDLAQELLKTKFKETWSQEELFTTDHAQNRLKVTFSMILKCDYEEKLYEQNEDPRRLVKLLEDKMLDYNYTFTQKPMSLIFFEDAIDHICRST
jgi:dynein heavy chain